MILILPNWQTGFRQARQAFFGIDIQAIKIIAAVAVACGLLYVGNVASTDVSAAAAVGPVSTKILDRNGEILYEIHGEVKRSPVSLDEISPHLIKATIAIEDENFYEHQGVSVVSIARAGWINLKNGSVEQGGSTITQQLVKNSLLTSEKSLERKFKEAVLALKLELKYDKEEILVMYMNLSPYGRNTYGAEAASLSYFGKHAKDLTMAEAAYLASLPQAPSHLSPFGPYSAELDKRKDYALERMRQLGYITEEEKVNAQTETVVFNSAKTSITAPYFVKMVEGILADKYGREYMETAGLHVYTTLDVNLQREAEKAVAEGAERNARNRGAYNAALVAIEPKTGSIAAFVGGKDYFAAPQPEGCRPGLNCKFEPQVNVATSLRQPGSSFKPYTYVTAFGPEFGYSPATKIMDKRRNFGQSGIKEYIPNNYTGKEYGLVSMRKALAGSLNIAAVQTLSMVGVANVAKTARSAGITSTMENCGLSLTLGACEVRLMDHTAGFATLANLGTYVEPRAILKIVDKSGQEIYSHEVKSSQVIDPRAAYLVVDIMKDNNARSYIFGSRSPLILPDRQVAAKTGTSQNFRDGWTVGYTPSLAVGVWTGNNDSTPMRQGADGVVTAGPIWNQFMKAALKDTPAEEFKIPEGIKQVRISAGSGKLATSYTRDAVNEMFADYSEPKAYDTYRPLEPVLEAVAVNGEGDARGAPQNSPNEVKGGLLPGQVSINQ